MRGPATTLSRVLTGGAPLAVVLYAEALQRDEIVQDIATLSRGLPVLPSTRVDDVFQVLDKIIALTPANEVEAVRTLAARRDALLERQAPAVLLLMRGGAGVAALSEEACSGLASWLQGKEVDPELLATVDLAAESKDFQQQTGFSPREWLDKARSGQPTDSLHDRLLTSRARFLEPGE